MYSALSKRIMPFLCRLSSWTESKFIIRSHFMAAVSGLIVSGVNFNFFCFVHNCGFCFLQVWCPTVFASSGHRILLKFESPGHFEYKMIKKNVQQWLHVISEFPCHWSLGILWKGGYIGSVTCNDLSMYSAHKGETGLMSQHKYWLGRTKQ